MGAFALAIVLLIVFWDWDWFLPFVERQAGSTLGRTVTASHLHVHLGRVTTATLDDVTVTEPAGFTTEPPVAVIKHLTVAVGVLDYVRGQGLVIPRVDVNGADADIVSRQDGSNNYTFKFMEPSTSPASAKPAASPKIGVVSIEDSHIDVAMAKLRARFRMDVHTTQDPADPTKDRVLVAANGTYAAQPIVGRLIAGALLTIRDKATPYPIDLHVANGPTRVSLVGTVEDPLKFSGANLRLVFEGPDMALLYPLTGVPIPTTPPYHVAGHLDYTKQRIVFRDFEGRLGTSDLGGTIAVDPHAGPPQLDANLHSHTVNLVDLGGFIGAKPGHPAEGKAAHAGTATSAGRAAVPAGGRANILPTTPFSLPKLNAMDVNFAYRGDHIEGKFIPLDNIVVDMTIHDGTVDLKKLDFGVGRGQLAGRARLEPVGQDVRADAAVQVRNVDLSHLLDATHVFHGKGIVGGGLTLNGQGNSIAGLVGHGSGNVDLFMRDGGNIASLLPDVLGLEFTNALLSAMGVPQRTNVACFVASMPLRDGKLDTKLFVLQTGEARTTGQGSLDFRNDTIDYALTTRSTRFSVGSLPGPIDVSGPMAGPSIRPGAEIIGRGAATVALGIVFVPLAILPTIQFGVGKSEACERAVGGTVSGGPAGGGAAGGSPAGGSPAGGSPQKASDVRAAPTPHQSKAQIHRAWEHRLHRTAGL